LQVVIDRLCNQLAHVLDWLAAQRGQERLFS
jgi:hypothetical protein